MSTQETVEIAHTTHKRDLDEMSQAHRAKIERWDAHLPKLGSGPKSPGQHVWATSPRFVGRGEGPHFVLIKVAPRDYRIGEYDSSKAARVKWVADARFESPKVALEAFKAYRVTAKSERDAARAAATATKTPTATTSKTKSAATTKTAKAKAPAKRVRKPKAS